MVSDAVKAGKSDMVKLHKYEIGLWAASRRLLILAEEAVDRQQQHHARLLQKRLFTIHLRRDKLNRILGSIQPETSYTLPWFNYSR